MTKRPITLTSLPIDPVALVRILRGCMYDLQIRDPELAETELFQSDLLALECAYVNLKLEKE